MLRTDRQSCLPPVRQGVGETEEPKTRHNPQDHPPCDLQLNSTSESFHYLQAMQQDSESVSGLSYIHQVKGQSSHELGHDTLLKPKAL